MENCMAFLTRYGIEVEIIIQDREHPAYNSLCALSLTHLTIEFYERMCEYVLFDPTTDDPDNVFHGMLLKKAIDAEADMKRLFVACNNSLYNLAERSRTKFVDMTGAFTDDSFDKLVENLKVFSKTDVKAQRQAAVAEPFWYIFKYLFNDADETLFRNALNVLLQYFKKQQCSLPNHIRRATDKNKITGTLQRYANVFTRSNVPKEFANLNITLQFGLVIGTDQMNLKIFRSD